MDVDKDATVVNKMEIKAMKKKKIDDIPVPDLVEDGNRTNKVEKKRKKDKRTTENNLEESRKREKSSLYKGTDVDKDPVRGIAVPDPREDGNHCEKMEKKKKKDKRKAKVASECNSAEISGNDCAEEENIYQNEQGKKKKKKDKLNPEVGSEIIIAETCKKNSDKADNNYQNENEKKKKKRRLEVVRGDQQNVTIRAAVKEKIYVQVVDDKDYKNGGERKEKKRRSKEKNRKYEDDSVSTPTIILKDKYREGFEIVKEQEIVHNSSYVEGNNEEGRTEKKKKKKKVGRNEDGGDTGVDESAAVEVVKKTLNFDTNVSNEVTKEQKIFLKANSIPMDNGEQQTEKKKRKKKVREEADNWGKGESAGVEIVGKMMNSDVNASEKVEKKRKRDKGRDLKDGEVTSHSTIKRSEGSETEGDKVSNHKETSAVESNSKDPKPKKTKKKVSFSNHDEVFPLEGGIVQGKRFSPKEDETVKQAVFDYINANNLGDEGLTMILNCKSHSKLKNCWKEIAEALPHRPYKSVYERAHLLFERDETHTWDTEDFEILRKYHTEHGPKWKQLADAMGKHRRHVKDAWRRNKLPNRKRGNWSQEEYQTLFDLVNADLKAKVNEEKKSKHGMLRDNISWTAISEKLASRNFATCCVKWYNQLTSTMIKEGEWADTDDYRLIDALYTLDACCIEDVDWDSLLEHRPGDICLKRWNQMANHIGEHGKKSFSEQVEILSKRYCPELIEAREAWDSKPLVP